MTTTNILLIIITLVVVGGFIIFIRRAFNMGREYERKRIVHKFMESGVDLDGDTMVGFNLIEILRDDS